MELCSACGERPGLLRITKNDGPAVLNCPPCAHSAVGSYIRTPKHPNIGPQLIRFFLALTKLAPTSQPTPPPIHPHTHRFLSMLRPLLRGIRGDWVGGV